MTGLSYSEFTTSIFRDDDFRALTSEEQRVYSRTVPEHRQPEPLKAPRPRLRLIGGAA